jgi:hypothetical protein
VASTFSAISVATLGNRFIRKWVAPIRIFSVAERMLDRFAAYTRGLWVLIQPRLPGLDDVFVFPVLDKLVRRCALILERACAARLALHIGAVRASTDDLARSPHDT